MIPTMHLLPYTIETEVREFPVAELMERFFDFALTERYCSECPSYGQVWSCPPFDFDTEERFGSFDMLKVFLNEVVIDQPGAQMLTAGAGEDEIEAFKRETFLMAKCQTEDVTLAEERRIPGSVAALGKCEKCPRCQRPQGRPCVNPETMRPSLESLGFLLDRAARDLFGVEMLWAARGEVPAYYVLISGIFYNLPA